MQKNKLSELVKDNVTIKNLESDYRTIDNLGPQTNGIRRIKNAKWIAIEKIRPDLFQPRKIFNEDSLKELAQSITEHGIRQPIVVELIDGVDSFQIVNGERRYRAAKNIGLKELPCIIQDKASSTLRFAQQLVENFQREDLNPIDKARALVEYKQALGENISWSKVERILGISETRRKQFVALLNLPENIQIEIVSLGKKPSKNVITEKHARALLMLNKLPNKQSELFEILKEGADSLSGDRAIDRARNMRGDVLQRVLKITYFHEVELIDKLEKKLKELRSRNPQ